LLSIYARIGIKKDAKNAGGKAGVLSSYTTPCGVCRQVMREFCTDSFPVYLTDGKGMRETTLGELLPQSFSPEDLADHSADN